MEDYLLGLLSGIAIMITYGHIVNMQQRRHQAKMQREYQERQQRIVETFFRPPSQTLEDQLKAAIERDDYEEAARIRNLIAKQ